jgi:hypothetical protein
VLNSEWGRLFHNWEDKMLPPDDLDIPGWEDIGNPPEELNKNTMQLIYEGVKILGKCIKEAPEFGIKMK